jgi:hypothetical protein
MKFNQQLIERVQRYWKARVGEDISVETATEYLIAFAGFYEALIGLMQTQ